MMFFLLEHELHEFMTDEERKEIPPFLRRMHVEEIQRHANLMDKMQSKPFKQGCLRIEFMDGTAEEYRIRPDDDPNEIIKFVQAITSNRVQELQRMIKQYE
jgi:hypothetical protein